jgi:hypothetical protein
VRFFPPAFAAPGGKAFGVPNGFKNFIPPPLQRGRTDYCSAWIYGGTGISGQILLILDEILCF